jgi:hypothetical protein
MIDVGELQVALNVWGVVHMTGYPHYTVAGNLFSPLPRLFGLSAAGAVSLFSTLWTGLALAGFYALVLRATRRPALAFSATFILGVARSIWVHSVVAEVYSLSVALLIALWLWALRPCDSRQAFRENMLLLAFLSGLAFAHHRALAFCGLGLAFVLWPHLRRYGRDLPLTLLLCLPSFAAGFLPYLYIPLRASVEGTWVYSPNLDTWAGFWFLVTGQEVDYLVRRPTDLHGWLENLRGTAAILGREWTPPGAALAIISLPLALCLPAYRRWAALSALSAAGFLAFAVAYHQAVLPEAIVMMSLPSFALSLALCAAWLWQKRPPLGYVVVGLACLWGAGLVVYQRPFIRDLTQDPTGLQAIESARQVPQNPLEKPVFMLSWGPRYFAASYARWVTGELSGLPMVDHRADFAGLAAGGATFYTQPDTLYGYPVAWWGERLGHAVYLTAAGENLVRLGRAPYLIDNPRLDAFRAEFFEGLWLSDYRLTCGAGFYRLSLAWYAESPPTADYSVKLHGVGADNPLPLIQADQLAPVYGWRPTSTWQAGELIPDVYRLPAQAGVRRYLLGLYEALPDGTFRDSPTLVLPLPSCEF